MAPDPRVEKVARALSRAGCKVEVLAWDRYGDLPAEEEMDGIRVRRLLIRSEFGRGLGNLPGLLRWQLALIWRLWRRRGDYDILHACDFDTVLPALLARLLWKKRVVYDVFDFYAEMLRSTPGPVKRIIRLVDLWVMGWVDAVILADEARRAQIAGARPRRLTVIYNTPEDLPVDALPKVPGRPRGSRLHLTFVGLLQRERGLLELLEVLRRRPDFSLDMAGFGGDADEVLRAAQGLPNVRFHGRVPYPVALALSRSADALVATYDPAIPNHRYASPNKLFEAMMLGKPIVVARGTGMDSLVEEHECGLIVKYGDRESLEAAFERLAADEGLRRRLGRNGRAAYERRFAWERMEQRLRDLYTNLWPA